MASSPGSHAGYDYRPTGTSPVETNTAVRRGYTPSKRTLPQGETKKRRGHHAVRPNGHHAVRPNGHHSARPSGALIETRTRTPTQRRHHVACPRGSLGDTAYCLRIQIKANLATTGRQILVRTTCLNQKCCVPIGFYWFSLFGKGKRLLSGSSTGTTNSLTGQLLAMVACTVAITQTLVRAALASCSIAELRNWLKANFGQGLHHTRCLDLTPTPEEQKLRKHIPPTIPVF